MSPPIHPTVRRFIEDAGVLTQSFGLGRVVGQIYAYLYFSREPRTLADMQHTLGISKGGASMSVRQLEQWNAVRRTWVRGDRKDYYEANDWLGKIAKSALVDIVGRKISALEPLIKDSPAKSENGDDDDFVQERIAHLRRFHDHVRKVWENPLVSRLLG